jgi:DNA-binding HxlR family transcriptional regulator
MDKQLTVLTDDCAKKIKAIDDTMYILGGKWKVSIIARLCYKPMRYSELLKNIKGISGKMLSRELQELEINGLINREVLTTKPLSVSYRISEHGKTLRLLTNSISEWGLLHREKILKSFVEVPEKE